MSFEVPLLLWLSKIEQKASKASLYSLVEPPRLLEKNSVALREFGSIKKAERTTSF